MIQLIVEALVSSNESTLVLESKAVEVVVSESLSSSRGYAAFTSSNWEVEGYTFKIEFDKKYVDSYKQKKSPITRALVAHELGHIFSGRLTDGITNEVFKDEQEADCWAVKELIRSEDYEALSSLYGFYKSRSGDESSGYPGRETQIRNLDLCNTSTTR